MILIGDKLVPFEDVFLIKNIKDIENTKANSTVLFDFNEEILTYCYKNELFCAVVVNSIKEAIYCNNLNVKYIISEKELSIELQKIADNYMYDSKILAIIDSNKELEQVAKLEIDGIIYRNLLK